MEQNLVDLAANNELATQSQNGTEESNQMNDYATNITSPLTANDEFIYESSIAKSLDFENLIDKPESEQTQQMSEPEIVQNEPQSNVEREPIVHVEVEQQTNGEVQKPINLGNEQSADVNNLVEPIQTSHSVESREAELFEQASSNGYLASNELSMQEIAPVSQSLLTQVANGKPENVCNSASSHSDRSKKIKELEKLVQQQNDEIVCLKSALNDTLRRINLIESNQSSHSSRAVSSSTVTTSFKKSANNSTSNLGNGTNSSKPPLSSTSKPGTVAAAATKNVPRPAGSSGLAKPQAV